MADNNTVVGVYNSRNEAERASKMLQPVWVRHERAPVCREWQGMPDARAGSARCHSRNPSMGKHGLRVLEARHGEQDLETRAANSLRY